MKIGEEEEEETKEERKKENKLELCRQTISMYTDKFSIRFERSRKYVKEANGEEAINVYVGKTHS